MHTGRLEISLPFTHLRYCMKKQRLRFIYAGTSAAVCRKLWFSSYCIALVLLRLPGRYTGKLYLFPAQNFPDFLLELSDA